MKSTPAAHRSRARAVYVKSRGPFTRVYMAAISGLSTTS